MRAAIAAFGLLLTIAANAGAAEIVSAPQAHDRAREGTAILIDIRRPQEWRQSGVAADAKLVSMHEEAFLSRLDELTGGRKDQPLLLICATGARSTWLAQQLEQRGYANLANVKEGMFGSASGPGWIGRGLPMRKVD